MLMLSITIDNKEYQVEEGKTILDVCNSNNILVPTLCYLKNVNDIGSCRMCMVEIEGYDNLFAACKTKVMDGMVITTNNKRINSYISIF